MNITAFYATINIPLIVLIKGEFMRINTTIGKKTVKGYEAISFFGIKLVPHKTRKADKWLGKFSVSEYSTGRNVSRGDTLEMAITNAKEKITMEGIDKTKQKIQEYISTEGEINK